MVGVAVTTQDPVIIATETDVVAAWADPAIAACVVQEIVGTVEIAGNVADLMAVVGSAEEVNVVIVEDNVEVAIAAIMAAVVAVMGEKNGRQICSLYSGKGYKQRDA
ncbi:hypothetical protein Ddc_17038 [Ditylenchus destructor]|nr:hypothetical protein Ddc_17038 [Ditylenchus destructor]